MRAAWNLAKRVMAITAVAAAWLAGGVVVGCVPSHAATGAPTVKVIDGPDAPRTMLQQFERLVGEPPSPLSKVIAIDTAGKTLADDQIDALLAGKEVQGVRVLGVIPGTEKILNATMADLSDGTHDGASGTTPVARSLLFGAVDPSSVPDHRDFCLTLCVYMGNGVWNCPWHPIVLPL